MGGHVFVTVEKEWNPRHLPHPEVTFPASS